MEEHNSTHVCSSYTLHLSHLNSIDDESVFNFNNDNNDDKENDNKSKENYTLDPIASITNTNSNSVNKLPIPIPKSKPIPIPIPISSHNMTVSVIRNVRSATIQEHTTLISLGYPKPIEGLFEIHVADVFEIEAAKKWFCDKNKTHPISKKDIGPIAKSRIKFRFDNQEHFQNIPSDNDITIAFNQYLWALVNGKLDFTSKNITMLRCHLEPEKLTNFFYMNREQAQDRVLKTKTYRFGPSWIIRPSKFKGYKFALDHDGKFYPITEYIAITFINEKNGEFVSELIEKVYSCGYYNCHGTYIKNSLDYKQGTGHCCFFDVLHKVLINLFKKHACNVRNININDEDHVWKNKQTVLTNDLYCI